MHEHIPSDIPVPSGWPKCVRSAVVHVISLAHYAIVAARGWAANSINARVRLAAENGRLKQEIGLLREEIRVKDLRTAKIHPRHRTHYRPTERMAILELKAMQACTIATPVRHSGLAPILSRLVYGTALHHDWDL